MKRCREQAENRVEWLLNLESSPFSLNTHYLSDYRAKFLAYYKAAREKYEKSDLMRSIEEYKQSPTSQTFSFRNTSGAASQQPTGIAKVLAALSEIGLWGIKAEDLANLLPPDSMAPALGIMADVRAYFQGKFISRLVYVSHLILASFISCLQTFHGYSTPRDRL